MGIFSPLKPATRPREAASSGPDRGWPGPVAWRRCKLGRRVNVAGHHFYLSQLIQHCKHPAVPDMPDTDLSSKMVSSDVLLNELMPDGFDFVQPVAAKKQKS